MEEIDIWRQADAMIKRYDEDASLQASLRADHLLNKGDVDGQRTWMWIIKAI